MNLLRRSTPTPSLRRRALAFAVICLLTASLPSAADMAQLRDVYDTHLSKIQSECSEKTRNWAAQYLKALQACRATAQRAGDLDGLTGANAEMKRFEADGGLTAQHIVKQPAGVREIQEKALAELQSYPVERDRAILDLVEKYVARLESEKTRLTKAGDVNAALDMNAEIKRVKASPGVADAEFNLALHTPAPPPERPDRPETQPDRKPAAPPKATRTSHGWVYPDGLRPEPPKGVSLRRQSTYTTANNPLARSVSVTLLTADAKGGGSSYRAGGRHHYHRVQVRSAKANEDVGAVTVCIDYFSKQGKTGYSSAGKVVPKLEDSHRFKLKRVSSETTTIDPIYVPSPYSSSSYSSYSTWYGRDYYGAIISVFSDSGVLLFQAGSVSGLKTAGRLKL